MAHSHATANHVLAQTPDTVNGRIRPVPMHDFLTADRIEATVAKHLGIVTAVLDRDVPLAVTLMPTSGSRCRRREARNGGDHGDGAAPAPPALTEDRTRPRPARGRR